MSWLKKRMAQVAIESGIVPKPEPAPEFPEVQWRLTSDRIVEEEAYKPIGWIEMPIPPVPAVNNLMVGNRREWCVLGSIITFTQMTEPITHYQSVNGVRVPTYQFGGDLILEFALRVADPIVAGFFSNGLFSRFSCRLQDSAKTKSLWLRFDSSDFRFEPDYEMMAIGGGSLEAHLTVHAPINLTVEEV